MEADKPAELAGAGYRCLGIRYPSGAGYLSAAGRAGRPQLWGTRRMSPGSDAKGEHRGYRHGCACGAIALRTGRGGTSREAAGAQPPVCQPKRSVNDF